MKDGLPGTVVKVGKFVCTYCRDDEHYNCIDIKRAKVGLGRICECAKHKTSSSPQASAAPSA